MPQCRNYFPIFLLNKLELISGGKKKSYLFTDPDIFLPNILSYLDLKNRWTYICLEVYVYTHTHVYT